VNACSGRGAVLVTIGFLRLEVLALGNASRLKFGKSHQTATGKKQQKHVVLFLFNANISKEIF
jgi:hypothetical protein